MARQQDILKQSIPTLLVTFGALLVLQTTRALSRPFGTESVEGVLSPVGVWFDSLLNPYVGIAVGLIATALASVIFARIINRYSLSVIRSFMPMVLYVVCAFGVVYPAGSPSVMMAMLMLTRSVELMLLSFKRHECFGEVMCASFWAAMAALIIPEMTYLLLLLPAQLLIWQRSPREIFASALMVPLPMLLASCLYWFGGTPFGWLQREWYNTFPTLDFVNFGEIFTLSGGVLNCVLWGLLTILTLLSILVFVGNYSSMRTRARKGHIIFSLLFLFGLLMLLIGCHTAVVLPVMGLASVPLIHTFFVRRKDVVSVVIYLIIIGLTTLSSLL